MYLSIHIRYRLVKKIVYDPTDLIVLASLTDEELLQQCLDHLHQVSQGEIIANWFIDQIKNRKNGNKSGIV